jgi:medium-chain acyl-[acyl-carrier-protein] hydrolase
VTTLTARGLPIACHTAQPRARVTLVCFPHAGGSALAFGRWASALAPDVELWSVTLPGRAGRMHEPFARDWGALVEGLATAVEDDIDGPFALFGHSLGATLAFEVSRELARRGASPSHLYGGVPAALQDSREVLDYFLPILRADIELAADYRYKPGPPLELPITALAGVTDATLSRVQVEGWQRQTHASFQYHEFPGGHFYVENQEPAVFAAIVARLLG